MRPWESDGSLSARCERWRKDVVSSSDGFNSAELLSSSSPPPPPASVGGSCPCLSDPKALNQPSSCLWSEAGDGQDNVPSLVTWDMIAGSCIFLAIVAFGVYAVWRSRKAMEISRRGIIDDIIRILRHEWVWSLHDCRIQFCRRMKATRTFFRLYAKVAQHARKSVTRMFTQAIHPGGEVMAALRCPDEDQTPGPDGRIPSPSTPVEDYAESKRSLEGAAAVLEIALRTSMLNDREDRWTGGLLSHTSRASWFMRGGFMRWLRTTHIRVFSNEVEAMYPGNLSILDPERYKNVPFQKLLRVRHGLEQRANQHRIMAEIELGRRVDAVGAHRSHSTGRIDDNSQGGSIGSENNSSAMGGDRRRSSADGMNDFTAII